MSDATNLNDFFAQNSKKKQKKKPAGKAQKNAAAQEATPAEDRQVGDSTAAATPSTAAAAEAPQPYASPFGQPDFGDSSDDESNTIVINDGRQKVIDRKELEASKKNAEDEKNDTTDGWGLGSKFGQQSENASKQMPSFSSAKGPQVGSNINFGGKPTFTRRAKGIMDQDFPDIGAAGSGNGAEASQSKANGPMNFTRGATTMGAKTADSENRFAAGGFGAGGFGGAREEGKGPATKPVFRGKAKLGGASNEEVQNSRMNYDFSKMNMSAATNGEKREEGEAGNRERPYNRNRDGAIPSLADDDDFEVVAEKPKKEFVPRTNFEEPSFGGGKPMFTRGGNNRQE